MNYWKEIWAEHSADESILHDGNVKDILFELKRSSGFDIWGGVSYESWMEFYFQMKKELFFMNDIEKDVSESVFEVGCGSGANLYLFEKDGMQCGGLDYSENLVNSARKILRTKDLTCGEALQLSTDVMYDAVFSNSVFSYFSDEEYAMEVLEKMYEKARYSIGITDILDEEKKEEFIIFRKKNTENYEERYRNLPKLSYSKKFFLDFASRHHADIKFTFLDIKGYWNNDFHFNCYIYKRREG